jgi:hypothetical protein
MSRRDPTADIATLLAQCEWQPCPSRFTLKRREVDDADFVVADCGTIFLVYPRSHAAQQWWRDHVDPGAVKLGRNFVIEHCFVQNILDALRRDGFVALNGGGEHA